MRYMTNVINYDLECYLLLLLSSSSCINYKIWDTRLNCKNRIGNSYWRSVWISLSFKEWMWMNHLFFILWKLILKKERKKSNIGKIKNEKVEPTILILIFIFTLCIILCLPILQNISQLNIVAMHKCRYLYLYSNIYVYSCVHV